MQTGPSQPRAQWTSLHSMDHVSQPINVLNVFSWCYTRSISYLLIEYCGKMPLNATWKINGLHHIKPNPVLHFWKCNGEQSVDYLKKIHVIIVSFIFQLWWSGAKCLATTRLIVICQTTMWPTLSSAWGVVRSSTMTDVYQWTTTPRLHGVTLMTLPVPLGHHSTGILLTTLSNAIFTYTKISIVLGQCFDLL